MVHRIDPYDRLVSFDTAFRCFAVANGAPDLPDEWLGRVLWDSSSSDEVNMVFRALAGRARQGTPVTVTSRCDSPNLERFVEIAIEPDEDDTVAFTSKLVRARFKSPGREPGELLRMCAWCFRVESDGWQGVEEVVAQRGLLLGAPVPDVTHGICPTCVTAQLDQLAATS